MAQAGFAGIDVSKDKVDVATRGTSAIESVWERTDAKLKELAESLRHVGVRRIVLEASGGYEWPILNALHDAGLEVHMLQPARARHFAKSMGRYTKTDAIDAALLAHMAEVAVDEHTRWLPREAATEELRALVKRRDHLTAMREAEKKRLTAARSERVRESIERSLAVLNGERATIEAAIAETVERSEHLSEKVERLTQVKGVALQTAVVLLSEVPELGTLNRNQAAALVGVAPMTRESGQWSGRRFIMGGRARARSALYMAALVGLRYNPHIKEFYAGLVARGKNKKLALIAAMRKLIIHLNALLRPTVDARAGAATDAPVAA